jgi:UDP-2,4-diacetamido-2,4,6-trideoxy-beta-L-altropyranose hydrolase
VFRADASIQIGTGHVMRCLTLADALQERGVKTLFICRELEGFSADMVVSRGHDLRMLPAPQGIRQATPDEPAHAKWLEVSWEKDAEETGEILESVGEVDWLVIDHYALDFKWESLLYSKVCKIMVIDDLADRRHECDFLLDQNLYDDMNVRYRERTQATCKHLLGPQFALLRSEFAEERKKSQKRNGKINNIFVCFGGGDAPNETLKVIQALEGMEKSEASVDIVVGKSNPHAVNVRNYSAKLPFTKFHYGAANMAELMGRADLAIGAGGVISWERCALSLPSIVIAIADNQIDISKALDDFGAVRFLGKHTDVTLKQIQDTISLFSNDSDSLIKMGELAGELVDGKGVHRVFSEIEKLS